MTRKHMHKLDALMGILTVIAALLIIFGRDAVGHVGLVYGVTIELSIAALMAIAFLDIVKIIKRLHNADADKKTRTRDILFFLLPTLFFLFQYGALYQWMAKRDPGAFDQRLGLVDAVSTTVGFLTTGSTIEPKTEAARFAVAIQQTGDLILLAFGLTVGITYLTTVLGQPDNGR